MDKQLFLVGGDELVEMRGVGELVGRLLEMEEGLDGVENVVLLLLHLKDRYNGKVRLHKSHSNRIAHHYTIHVYIVLMIAYPFRVNIRE